MSVENGHPSVKSAQLRLAGDSYGRKSADPAVHATAVVAPGARLGDGTVVGPFSVIGPNVVLGKNNIIGSHVVIEGFTTIGDENQIYQFASVGAVPQDKKFYGEQSTLEIGDRNIIREYVTLQPGTSGGGMKTVIGSGNLFMACTHVGHDCIIGNDNVFANSAALAGHVRICNRVTVGGLAGIHQFAAIGDLVLIGAGAMVSQDIPPFCIAQGDRACLVGINVIGMQRAGYSADEVAACRKLYRDLFMSRRPLAESLKVAREAVGAANGGAPGGLLEFIASSSRGVAPRRRGASDNS